MIPIIICGATSVGQANFSRSNAQTKNYIFTSDKFKVKLAQVLRDGKEDVVAFITEDTVLPTYFEKNLADLVLELEKNWGGWGAAGSVGICPFAVGMSHKNLVSYRSDAASIPSGAGHILPATSILPDVLLVNLNALRGKGVENLAQHKESESSLALAFTLTEVGLGMVIAPQLATFQLRAAQVSPGTRRRASRTLGSTIAAASSYKEIATVAGIYSIPMDRRTGVPGNYINFEKASFSIKLPNLSQPSVAIAVRTQFRDLTLLNRTVTSCLAFMAAAEGNFRIVILTDRVAPLAFIAPEEVEVLRLRAEGELDTRLLLVKFGAEQIDAEYLWFVDDDDWVFPNEANPLTKVLSNAPEGSLVFVGSRHFHESGLKTGVQTKALDYKINPGHYFSTTKFKLALTGLNQIPFCSVLWPIELVRSLPGGAVSSITYAEDFFLLLHSLSNAKSLVFFDRMMVGISIRKDDNTVTEKNRRKWNLSNANIAHSLASNLDYDRLLSSYSNAQLVQADAARPFVGRRFLMMLADPNAWRAFMDLNIFSRLLRRQMTVSELVKRILIILR